MFDGSNSIVGEFEVNWPGRGSASAGKKSQTGGVSTSSTALSRSTSNRLSRSVAPSRVSQATVVARKPRARATASSDKPSQSQSSVFARAKLGLLSRLPSAPMCLIVVVSVMVVAGLSMCYSTTFMTRQVAHSELFKQLFFVFFGIGLSAVLMVLAKFLFTERRELWFLFMAAFWLVSLVLVALVFVPGLGVMVNGAVRWLQIGSFRFQPSELAKVALVLFTAAALEQLDQKNSSTLRWFLMVSYVVLQLMAFKQNDFGTVMLLHLGLLAVMVMGNRPFRGQGIGVFSSLGFLLIVPVVVLVGTYFDSSFRQGRWAAVFCKLTGSSILTELAEADQVRNGILALGDGGLFGLGAGLSKQKYFYLPEADNDFVFAIIGEEFGLIGTGLVLVLFLLLAWFGLSIARNAYSSQGKMIAGGATSLLVGQALVNIGGIVGASPMTGKPLPFFSSGGSSMAVSILLVACILMVAWFDTVQVSAVRRQDSLRVVRGGGGASYGSSNKTTTRSRNQMLKQILAPLASSQGRARR